VKAARVIHGEATFAAECVDADQCRSFEPDITCPASRHGCSFAEHERYRTMTKPSFSRRNVLTILGALPVVSGILPRSNAALAQTATAADPLPSWNDGDAK